MAGPLYTPLGSTLAHVIHTVYLYFTLVYMYYGRVVLFALRIAYLYNIIVVNNYEIHVAIRNAFNLQMRAVYVYLFIQSNGSGTAAAVNW